VICRKAQEAGDIGLVERALRGLAQRRRARHRGCAAGGWRVDVDEVHPMPNSWVMMFCTSAILACPDVDHCHFVPISMMVLLMMLPLNQLVVSAYVFK